MTKRRRQRAWGSVYKQPLSRYWYLRVKYPGEPLRRQVTNPRTEDEDEARRQLHELLAERGPARRQRRTAEQTTVADLLDLVLLDYADHGRRLQQGRAQAWYTALGTTLATEVERADLDEICRRWRRHPGPTWGTGTRILSDGRIVSWPARPPERRYPLSGASMNRYLATLERAYTLGKEKLGLMTALTFPHFEEHGRGEYITEDQCLAICTNFQAKVGAQVKADVFRLAYLIGARKGQWRDTRKKNVVIDGDLWKLVWASTQTKTKQKTHAVVLVGEARAIVERAWANRLPDCDYLFHVGGKPLGSMRSELERTCTLLGIPYGRAKGIVWHDTRHSAVTNLVASGTGEAVAMSMTNHADPSVFKRYNVRRDPVQAEAVERLEAYLRQQRGTTPTIPVIGKKP